MKRFRFRKLICASAIGVTLGAAILGTAVLSEAAGPRQLISGLWNRRPTLSKLADSRLNPRTWAGPTKDEKPRRARLSDAVAGGVSTSRSGLADSSSRPELYNDPFAMSGDESDLRPNSAAGITRKSASQAALSPRQRRDAGRSKSQNSRSVDGGSVDGNSVDRRMTETDALSGSQQMARRNEAPIIPDGLEDASADRSFAAAEGSGNQFSNGFDQEFQRLIKSVIAETEESVSSVDDMSSAGELARRKLAGTSDSMRGPVSAPRIPSRPAGVAGSVQDLIKNSRQDMSRAMKLLPDDAESPLVTARPEQSPISLTEATGRTQLQPLDGPQRMIVPSVESPGGSVESGQSGAADFRNGLSGDAAPRRIEEASRVGTGGSVRPRVISNGAPAQSVPNNRQYERISYDSGDEGPLFGSVVEAPRVAAGGLNELEAAADARQVEGVSSAPIIDWSLDTDSNEPASAGSIPWGFASVLVVAATTLLAILLLTKRQVVTVVTSGTAATDETA